MKAFLLLTVSLAFVTTLCAQTVKPNLKQLEEYRQKYRPNLPKTDLHTLAPNLGVEGWVQTKPGVYALPQDNMPCVVPNTKDIAQIPNVMGLKSSVAFGQIPNATPQTGEELRQNFKRLYAPPGR